MERERGERKRGRGEAEGRECKEGSERSRGIRGNIKRGRKKGRRYIEGVGGEKE